MIRFLMSSSLAASDANALKKQQLYHVKPKQTEIIKPESCLFRGDALAIQQMNQSADELVANGGNLLQLAVDFRQVRQSVCGGSSVGLWMLDLLTTKIRFV
jgi:hypothetical protein